MSASSLTTAVLARRLGHHARRPDGLEDLNNNWNTSSPPSNSIPSTMDPAAGSPSNTTPETPETTGTNTPANNSPGSNPGPTSSPGSSSNIASGPGEGLTTFTTSFPTTTVTDSTTTFTSFFQTVVITRVPSMSSTTPTLSSPSGSAGFSTASPSPLGSASQQICIGDGLDASAQGLLAAVIVPSAIGLLLWIIFAILRPRFRQVYALREWFVQSSLRPKPLGSSFFAFLFPHVPLVPPVPSDVSDAGRSAADDAELFPSDEQLNQRALWISLVIVFGWTILGLAGALPLYLIQTPCIAQLGSSSPNGGAYSTLQDLSLLRLLKMLDSGNISTINQGVLQSRAVLDDEKDPQHVRIRMIVLTVMALVLALLPALIKIMREFSNAVAYRKRWIEVKCEGKELGWLSASKAPGFVGWGEKRLKDYLLKNGLSSKLETGEGKRGARARNGNRQTRRGEEQPLSPDEEAHLEVDVQSLFSIGDTQHLALLVDERDEILENLEIAETRYIGSFRITTPDPSIADYQPPPPQDPNRPYISRPLPLGNNTKRSIPGRRRRAVNPAFAASSLAPTSFVAPSQYYKLRGVQGVSGGRFADSGTIEHPSLTDSINSRVIGSRFQEVNRNSVAYGRLPLGSHVKVEKSGELGPSSPRESFAASSIPDPRRFGPNHPLDSSNETEANDYGELGVLYEDESGQVDEDWVDLSTGRPADFDSDYNGVPPARSSRRPKKEPAPAGRRETFPLRNDETSDPDNIPPPHLRLQPSQPFVRPLDGINYDDLGHVYEDITQWRSKLKAINAEIANAQRESYNDIAEGARIKGWLMIGRGLRFVPGIQLIEGRAKEDVRWDVLQTERGLLDWVVVWTVMAVIVVLLAAGLTAASGLALSTAPDMNRFFPFLRPLLNSDALPTGLATVFAPAVAATLFIMLALAIVNWAVNIHGSVSISGGQLLVFKTTFWILTAVAAIFLIGIGAILFALQNFDSGSGETQSIANGSIYMSVLALTVIVNVAIIFPGILLLQPFRLWRVVRAERQAVTPRQRFRAVYPQTYNPSFATGACVLAIVFASTFSLIFPLIGPAVTILLLLTLIAHRFLVGYVYARTHSQTGGILQIWLLKRFGTLLSLQPLLLGLIFLSRQFWIEGGILVGSGVAVIIFVETYTNWKTRLPGRKSLSAITQNSLDALATAAKPAQRRNVDEESTSLVSTAQSPRIRGSMASVLEMMSLTLAVMPSPSVMRGAIPLQTETLDDLTATERAARTHPDAPPHLPPLPFADHAEEMAGILYAPELIAPPPIIWLPNDSAGVARSEAVDLQKYHDLQVTLDVRAMEDVIHRRSSSVRGPSR